MNKRVHQSGMALMLELLLGFVLLTVAVFALFALFPSGDKAVMRAVRTNQAGEIARGLMEERMSRDYPNLVLGTLEGEVTNQGVTRNGAELSTQFFYRVEVAQPIPDRNFKDIRVEVYWLEGAREQKHSCLLESSKGDYF